MRFHCFNRGIVRCNYFADSRHKLELLYILQGVIIDHVSPTGIGFYSVGFEEESRNGLSISATTSSIFGYSISLS